MTAWIIILTIALLLALILCVRVRLIVTYTDDGVRLRIRILGIPFTVLPKKEKRLKLRHYTPEALGKRRRKLEKKRLKKEKKAAEKQQKKDKQKRTELLESAREKHKKSIGDIAEQLRFLTDLISSALGRLFRCLRTDVYALSLNIATGDPASTAVTYGAVSAAADALLTLLQKTRQFRIRKRDAVQISADFLAERTTAKVHIVLSVRPFRIIGIGLRALWRLLKRQMHSPS